MPQMLLSLAISLAISLALSLLMSLLKPKPKVTGPAEIPKPEDGKYNFKQNVPSLVVALGRVKKGGDYVLLEERDAIAYHITAFAAHRIQGYLQHFLHDEATAVEDGKVTVPEHFLNHVYINERLGLPAETAYPVVVDALSEIWTYDHRGDGIASLMMMCISPLQDQYLTIFPQQMPILTSVADGALLYDPRTGLTAYSRNIALFRLFHMTHPSGIKLTLDDLYLPEWAMAADVCDEIVLNKQGEEEQRYIGGIWYRYDNDPVDIGLQMDEAADMVPYERADGKIGVHPGAFVEPDIIITKDDILEISYDTNRRLSTNVLAVRGRFNDPENIFNTTDAAIYGNPYEGASDNTERTKTVDNLVVESHNHCQRLQKLAFIRANAPRVNLKVIYDPLRPIGQLPYRRFVRIDYSERGLDMAAAEIINRPKLSLSDLTYTFDAIIVPDGLYDFDADTEEGELPPVAFNIPPLGVPEPEGFVVLMGTEDIGAGQMAVYAAGVWDFVSQSLAYEMQFYPDGAPESVQSVFSTAGLSTVRTGYLQDGLLYFFRVRAWSGGVGANGTPSDWTNYVAVTATANVTAPGQPTSFNTTRFTNNDVLVEWVNPNSSQLYKTSVWRATSNSFGAASVIYNTYAEPNVAQSYTDPDLVAGTYYYWVQSSNASGIASSAVGSETETVT